MEGLVGNLETSLAGLLQALRQNGRILEVLAQAAEDFQEAETCVERAEFGAAEMEQALQGHLPEERD